MPRKALLPETLRRALPAVLALLCAGCAPHAPPRQPALRWLVAQAPPAFDPAGPPDPVAWTFLRLLGRGLVAIDSAGRAVPDAAERVETSPDGRRVVFHLPALRFADGTLCTSADFERALRTALERRDHTTARWLLSAVEGVPAIRSGRALPRLGIACPDPATLELRLSRPDSRLLEKLALPGLAMPWKRGAAEGWEGGIGAWRRLPGTLARWTLVRTGVSPAGPAGRSPGPAPASVETLHVRFAIGAGRVHSVLRDGDADLVWPLPPGLLALPTPPGYRIGSRNASPERWLLLVLRADLPPTSRPEARHALGHGLDRPAILAALGVHGGEGQRWPPEGDPFEFPAHDQEQVRSWLERGRLGRSLHVVLGYAADREGAEVARSIQSEWARLALDAELQPGRGEALIRSRIDPVGPHAMLVELQPLAEGPAALLAGLIMPLRDAAPGPVRTGWRTREFDAWIGPAGSGEPDLELVQRRLAEECVALPLARLPWVWMERSGGPAIAVDRRYGPQPGDATAPPPPGR